MLYTIFQDGEGKEIVLNNRYSRERLRRKLWKKTNLTMKAIDEIVCEGIYLEDDETLEIRSLGRGKVMSDKENIIFLLRDGERIIIYSDSSFERIYTLGDWFLDRVKTVKRFFFG